MLSDLSDSEIAQRYQRRVHCDFETAMAIVRLSRKGNARAREELLRVLKEDRRGWSED